MLTSACLITRTRVVQLLLVSSSSVDVLWKGHLYCVSLLKRKPGGGDVKFKWTANALLLPTHQLEHETEGDFAVLRKRIADAIGD